MPTKAKRVISKFNFQAENSAVALVSASQGGAANSYKTLMIKSADKYSKEFIEKAQKVQVTLEFDDFLQKFFGMWKEDAKILTSILGFDDESMQQEGEDDLGVYNDDYFYEWFDEKLEKEGSKYRSPTKEDKKEWLEYRKQGITLVKSLAESDDRLSLISNLTEQEYWSLINEQALFEKALNKNLNGSMTAIQKASTAVNNNEGKNAMSDNLEDVVALKKALDEQKAIIEKAQADLAAFKQKEKEQLTKARNDQLVQVVGEEKATELLKSFGEVSEQDFSLLVGVMKSLTEKLDNSKHFNEVGSKDNGVAVAKAALTVDQEVAEMIKKKYAQV